MNFTSCNSTLAPILTIGRAGGTDVISGTDLDKSFDEFIRPSSEASNQSGWCGADLGCLKSDSGSPNVITTVCTLNHSGKFDADPSGVIRDSDPLWAHNITYSPQILLLPKLTLILLYVVSTRFCNWNFTILSRLGMRRISVEHII